MHALENRTFFLFNMEDDLIDKYGISKELKKGYFPRCFAGNFFFHDNSALQVVIITHLLSDTFCGDILFWIEGQKEAMTIDAGKPRWDRRFIKRRITIILPRIDITNIKLFFLVGMMSRYFLLYQTS